MNPQEYVGVVVNSISQDKVLCSANTLEKEFRSYRLSLHPEQFKNFELKEKDDFYCRFTPISDKKIQLDLEDVISKQDRRYGELLSYETNAACEFWEEARENSEARKR